VTPEHPRLCQGSPRVPACRCLSPLLAPDAPLTLSRTRHLAGGNLLPNPASCRGGRNCSRMEKAAGRCPAALAFSRKILRGKFSRSTIQQIHQEQGGNDPGQLPGISSHKRRGYGGHQGSSISLPTVISFFHPPVKKCQQKAKYTSVKSTRGLYYMNYYETSLRKKSLMEIILK